MKIQFNKQTKMTWVYLPNFLVKILNINKGDEVEFIKVEEVKDIEKDKTYIIKKK